MLQYNNSDTDISGDESDGRRRRATVKLQRYRFSPEDTDTIKHYFKQYIQAGGCPIKVIREFTLNCDPIKELSKKCSPIQIRDKIRNMKL